MRHLIALAMLGALIASCTGQSAAAADRPLRILTGEPSDLDPAAQGDAGSAAITAQLFESLTSFDGDLHIRPALAASWQFADGGRQVTFHLRPDLTFSDGSPLRPSDVVRSWLRIIDPSHPSPLASLAFDIAGAEAYARGTSTDPSSVGLRADDTSGDLVVDLGRPATDFVNIVAGPTFSVVPASIDSDPNALVPGPDFVASGGYVLTGTSSDGLELTANTHYWAGTPAIKSITLVGSLGGQSPVTAFSNGDLDYTPVYSIDATWLAYDPQLGPQLRLVSSLSVQYYGFDTTKPPFDDVRVRQAIAEAVDWRRMAALSAGDEAGQVANSMVPPGIPGRSDADFLPRYDPVDARRLLAEAGYPGGAGFPSTVLMTDYAGFDAAIVGEVKRELGITLQAETMGAGYFDRLETDPPAMWALAWVADYPGRNDFLGVLLDSGSTNNYGHWSSSEFDAAIAAATSAADSATASAAYDRAETIVRDEAPVIPVVYGPGLGTVTGGSAGRWSEWPRDHPDGRPGVGELMRRLVAAVLAVVVLMSIVPSTAAAGPATFGTPRATSTYGQGIDFEQPVSVGAPIGRVEILLTIADAIGPDVVELPDRPSTGSSTLTYTLDTSGPSHLIPNTRVVARWRLFAADDETVVAIGPPLSIVYADDRFTWQTKSSDLVRVHWYRGDASFAAKALKLGEDEVRATSALLGVTETEPIDFFVYANVDDFYGALGPGAHENVAGTAYADIRTLLGLIPPDQIDDPLVAVRIPHEFVHMVFDTASSNPYHSPPRWLNEGLAVSQSEGYGSSDRSQVRSAARSGTLIPLDGLTGQFPNGQDFFLAYAESVAAVDFMIRTYGSDALVTLIRSYSEGRTDAEAFTDALGLDMTAFGQAWFEDVGATAPEQFGPQPAPPRADPGCLERERGRCRERCPAGNRRGIPDDVRIVGSRRRAGPRDRADRRRRRARGRPHRRRDSTAPAEIGRMVMRVTDRLRAIPSWQVTLGIALLALGFLTAAQLASERPRVAYTTQERTPLVETVTELQAQQDGLKAGILDLRAQIQGVEGQGAGSEDRVRQLNTELQAARIAAGLIPLTGPGIVIQLEDSQDPVPPGGSESDYLVSSRDIRTVVGALWEAGAEAIAVNGERITPTSSVIDVGPSVLVNSAYLTPPYQITALGPSDLYDHLSGAAAFVDFLSARSDGYGIRVSLAEPDSVDMPAFAGTITLRYSRPIASPSASPSGSTDGGG